VDSIAVTDFDTIVEVTGYTHGAVIGVFQGGGGLRFGILL